jgi:precorrin-6B methylase 2
MYAVTAQDHRALLQDAVGAPGGTWADLGSGTGAFTKALAGLLGPGGKVYSVDADAGALRVQGRQMRELFPALPLILITGDFTGALDGIPPLDGIVMANSLHFQRDACRTLLHVTAWLKPGGRLVVVEYDIERPSPWVPYPVPFSRLHELAGCAGLEGPRLIETRPSSYNRRVYSGLCTRL